LAKGADCVGKVSQSRNLTQDAGTEKNLLVASTPDIESGRGAKDRGDIILNKRNKKSPLEVNI
jgi:hypothetical protein